MSKPLMKSSGRSGYEVAQFALKYWGYLAAKLGLAYVILFGLHRVLLFSLPKPTLFRGVEEPFGHSLGYTVALMSFWLVVVGVIWMVIWDHRYLCRTCARRLRMPVATGTWTNVLFSRPRTEYICPYGHGTLKVEELQITGHSEPDWQPHEDMWKELISFDDRNK